ncbi:MAG: cupin domain-containing protein [Nanoarchaeota archaeon]
MKKIEVKPQFTDERGEIMDLLEKETIDAITVITFTKGAVRANHFHKKTTQWNYLISGKVLIKGQKQGEKAEELIMKPGDFVVSETNEAHALKALEKSTLMVFTKGPRGGKEYESDTFRLEKPLIPRDD